MTDQTVSNGNRQYDSGGVQKPFTRGRRLWIPGRVYLVASGPLRKAQIGRASTVAAHADNARQCTANWDAGNEGCRGSSAIHHAQPEYGAMRKRFGQLEASRPKNKFPRKLRVD